MYSTQGSCWSHVLTNLRTPRAIAILLAFLLSGAGLALFLTGGLGRGPTGSAGPVTGSPP